MPGAIENVHPNKFIASNYLHIRTHKGYIYIRFTTCLRVQTHSCNSDIVKGNK